MRRDGGLFMVDLMVYIVFFALAAGAAVAAWRSLHATGLEIARAQEDLDTAERFLEEWKDDVRRADRVEVSPDEVVLGFDGAPDVVYRYVNPETGLERRVEDDVREYRRVFDGAAFSDDGPLVAVDLELRRSERGTFRPRLGARVFPVRRKETP